MLKEKFKKVLRKIFKLDGLVKFDDKLIVKLNQYYKNLFVK